MQRHITIRMGATAATAALLGAFGLSRAPDAYAGTVTLVPGPVCAAAENCVKAANYKCEYTEGWKLYPTEELTEEFLVARETTLPDLGQALGLPAE